MKRISKEEIARTLTERPEIARLMRVILAQPEDKQPQLIETALAYITGRKGVTIERPRDKASIY